MIEKSRMPLIIVNEMFVKTGSPIDVFESSRAW